MQSLIDIFIRLINSMAVMMVLAYIVTRSRLYTNILEKKITNLDRLFLILLFGAFSIYGTLSGFKIMGAFANIRDLGPAIAGLIAGPIVGLGAGLIGGIHRYSLGGFTCEACSISTVVAGLAGGVFHLIRKGGFPTIGSSMILMVAIELFHMALALLISRPFDRALALVKEVITPMVLANGIGMGIYAFIIKNLFRERAVEAEKQMIEGELKAAREIQMGIVPTIFPPFPNRPEFEIDGILVPAKEVGGDFYDFFFIDNNHLFFAIGDVSGKGVPASLFMAVTITLLRAKAIQGMGTDKVLKMVNENLCRENDAGMFVTVFCGILNTQTGEVEYGNAGHNPPFIIRKKGIVEELSSTGDPFLGALGNASYKKKTTSLERNDAILIYTDGVTEAMDERGNFFMDERLVLALEETIGMTANKTVDLLMSKVHDFTSGAAQSDDITILALRYTNSSK